jgi:hypothetical protein
MDKLIKLRPAARLRIRTAKLPFGQRHKGQDVYVELLINRENIDPEDAIKQMRELTVARGTFEISKEPGEPHRVQEVIQIPMVQAVSWRTDSRAGYATAVLDATGVELDVEGEIPEGLKEMHRLLIARVEAMHAENARLSRELSKGDRKTFVDE